MLRRHLPLIRRNNNQLLPTMMKNSLIPSPSCLNLTIMRNCSSPSSSTASTTQKTSTDEFKNWFEYVQKEIIPNHHRNNNKQVDEKQITDDDQAEQKSRHEPPQWFQKLCEDLYFRRGNTKNTNDNNQEEDSSLLIDKMAKDSGEGLEEVAMMQRRPDDSNNTNNNQDVVDPFLWLEFNILPEEEYRFESFEFPHCLNEHFSPEAQQVLCGGDGGNAGTRKTMCCFATGYKFPDRRQLPITVGTEPSYLWIDPSNPNSQTVYIQLSPVFPPAMWLPVRGTASAIRRVYSEFAINSAEHRDRHEEVWKMKWEAAVNAIKKSTRQFRDESSKDGVEAGTVLRWIAHANSRDNIYNPQTVREFHNSQEFFLGEYSDPESDFQKYMDLCPTVFSTPLFRTNVNLHEPEHTPTFGGPGVATSLFRTVFSKSLLLVQVHLATEVKLPPLDHDAFRLLWSDSGNPPPSRVPIFIRSIWPDSEGNRLSGGGHVMKYLNATMGTEFAHDTPIDVAFSLLYLSQWVKRPRDFLGVHGMRQRLLEVEQTMLRGSNNNQQISSSSSIAGKATSSSLSVENNANENITNPLYPGTAEIPSPYYTPEEVVAMHIQYSAHLQDPLAKETIKHYMGHQSGSIRRGCAKAALEIGDRELFKMIIENEPDGRSQDLLSRLVRRRKKRDLLDQELRVEDGQFELPPPIWANGRKIDPGSREGQRYFSKTKFRGNFVPHKADKNPGASAKASRQKGGEGGYVGY